MNKQVRKGRHVTQYCMIEPYRYFSSIWWLFLQPRVEVGAIFILRSYSCAQTTVHGVIQKIAI